MSQLDLEPMDSAPKGVPLAELLRPQRLEDVVGQDKLIGPDGRLRRMLDSGELASIIFWGPPGTGKTTIARLLADAAGMVFEPVSAVFDGVADLRKMLVSVRTSAVRFRVLVGHALHVKQVDGGHNHIVGSHWWADATECSSMHAQAGPLTAL